MGPDGRSSVRHFSAKRSADSRPSDFVRGLTGGGCLVCYMKMND